MGRPDSPPSSRTEEEHELEPLNAPCNDNLPIAKGELPKDHTFQTTDPNIFNPDLYVGHNVPEELDVWLRRYNRDKPVGPWLTPLHFGIDQVNDICLDRECIMLMGGGLDSLMAFRSQKGLSYIHLAAMNSQHQILKVLLEEIPLESTFLQDPDGHTALHYLIETNGPTLDENAMTCLNYLLNKDKYPQSRSPGDKSFMVPANQGQTPLHIAVKYGNLELSKTLVKYYSGRKEWEQSQWTGSTVPTNLWKPLLHFIPMLCDDSDDTVEIMKLLLNRRGFRRGINRVWNGYTPLHFAVLRGSTKMVDALVEKADCFALDHYGRTPLHYVAILGTQPCAIEIMKHLIGGRVPFNLQQKLSLYKVVDNTTKCVFQHITDNCTHEAALLLLNCSIPRPDVPLSDRCGVDEEEWRNVELGLEECSRRYPILLHHMLQIGFMKRTNLETHKDEFGKKKICVGLSRITGRYGKDNCTVENHSDASFEPEFKKLRTGMHTWTFQERDGILLHPVVQYIVYEKLRRIKRYMAFFIAAQIVMFAALTVYTDMFVGGHEYLHHTFSLYCVLFYATSSMVYELFEMVRTKSLYWKQYINIGQLFRNVLMMSSTAAYIFGYRTLPRASLAVGVILAFPLMMRHFRQISKVIGQTVDIFAQVVIIICKALASCFCILWGFTLGIHLLFQADVVGDPPEITAMKHTWPSPFYKVLIMMSGEFDYEFGTTLEWSSPALRVEWAARNIVFFTFLVAIIFAYFNHLTGVALSKVQEMQQKAEVQRVVSKIEYIFFVETLLHTFESVPPFKYIFGTIARKEIIRCSLCYGASSIRKGFQHWLEVDTCRPQKTSTFEHLFRNVGIEIPSKEVFEKLRSLEELGDLQLLTKDTVACHDTCIFCNRGGKFCVFCGDRD